MLYERLCEDVCVCVHVPAICKEELEVSHVDLPQRNTVALSQRQSDSVHVVLQRPKHVERRKIMIRFHHIEAERAIAPTHMHKWYKKMQTK